MLLNISISGAKVIKKSQTKKKKNKKIVNSDTKVKIIYYQDIIEKSYMVEQDCEVFVKPIIIDSYHYGQHNVIL